MKVKIVFFLYSLIISYLIIILCCYLAIVTDEQLREGRRQLQRHKKTTERKVRRGELKSFIAAVTAPTSKGGIFSMIFGGGKFINI